MISICQLDGTYYAAKFVEDCEGTMIIAHDTKSGILYTTTLVLLSASRLSLCLSLWHNKLGYMSFKGMKMFARGALKGLKSIDMGLC